MSRLHRIATIAAVVAVAALPAFAQSSQEHASGPPVFHSWMMGPGWMGSGFGMGPAFMMGAQGMMPMMAWGGSRFGTDHIEGRLAFLRSELAITDEQKPQWNAFADVVKENAERMTQMHQSMRSGGETKRTLPERLALEHKAMMAHLDALDRVTGVLDRLYLVLSPEQKKTADDLIVGPMGMPMGMM